MHVLVCAGLGDTHKYRSSLDLDAAIAGSSRDEALEEDRNTLQSHAENNLHIQSHQVEEWIEGVGQYRGCATCFKRFRQFKQCKQTTCGSHIMRTLAIVSLAMRMFSSSSSRSSTDILRRETNSLLSPHIGKSPNTHTATRNHTK